MATYKIHPGIGIARVGNSDTGFYLAPEVPAGLPHACDAAGNPLLTDDLSGPVLVKNFKDKNGRIKRQAARFQVFVYDDETPHGRPLKLGDAVEGGGNRGKLIDIQWRVYLANKKSSWYEFNTRSGEHGYAAIHPRRNAAVENRDRLVIDPGPRTINSTDSRRASFDRSGNGVYAATFPPQDLKPHGIDTLGEIMTDDSGRLLVLGGLGRSGSEKTGPGEPHISHYANNDGWYDDISDGPVMARLAMYSDQVGAIRYIDVEYPAWAVVAYPRFVPQIHDMITMDEVLYDLFLREFAYDTGLYGRLGSFACPETIPVRNQTALSQWLASRLTWNKDFKPWFYRDIWPILFRPNEFLYLSDILAQSNFPHDQEQRGTFDPVKIGQTPGYKPKHADPKPADICRDASLGEAFTATSQHRDDQSHDPYRPMRQFLFDLLRRSGEDNEFKLEDKVGSRVHNLPLMPLLCGDNPLTNEVVTKFLRLTDYQLFILKQWAEGQFINEMEQDWINCKTYPVFFPYPQTPPKNGRELDRGVLSNALGGAFCPGGELNWIIRNPSIYWEPYRIKADRSLSDFLQSAAQANANRQPPSVIEELSFSVNNPLSQDNDFATGLQPGDLTKYMAVPWQADFNECTTNTINITYADWNTINPGGDNDQRLKREEKMWDTLWWPAHRPLQSSELTGFNNGQPVTTWTDWSRGIQQTYAGDLKMVEDWWKLGFIIRNPYMPNIDITPSTGPDGRYYSIERYGSGHLTAPDPQLSAIINPDKKT
ncbi:MAG: LodA/GoxA family CTQ-dependent oxidase [Proteobacteria bacterium]|nr:LodA/GoxA family CTQ-dependent oxidase [Pseudomonadota bacterium]